MDFEQYAASSNFYLNFPSSLFLEFVPVGAISANLKSKAEPVAKMFSLK